LNITTVKFLGSSSSYKNCPNSQTPEFAFIGRSNVGKSSLINTLLNNNNIAKTSKKPGKTKLINHYLVNDTHTLVDLPGYGWAADSKENRYTWNKMTQNYLLNRQVLKRLFLLIDLSIDPQAIDLNFLTWCITNNIKPCIIFTKIDKLSKNKIHHNLSTYTRLINTNITTELDQLCISNITKEGKTHVWALIANSSTQPQ
jgi:GTP-binding protein